MGKGGEDTSDRAALLHQDQQALFEGDPALPAVRELIPLGDEYIENNYNVLLMGLHGTGKTESIDALARKHGLRVKYYSCATLDPYTDLVGIPTPRLYCEPCDQFYQPQAVQKYWETRTNYQLAQPANGSDNFEFNAGCPRCSRELIESLKMIRPHDINQAEMIFVDELNRADEKTLNAIFEITQFHTINGEPLPNLRMVWGAINPPDNEQDYTVDELDPAFEDRFDAYVDLAPRPSVSYMQRYVPKVIAQALKDWWSAHDQNKRDKDSYISPRRLMKIGVMYDRIDDPRVILQGLPAKGTFDSKKLVYMLQEAKHGDPFIGNTIGAGPAKFAYTANWLAREQRTVAKYLQDNPHNLETHQRVGATLQGVNGKSLLTLHGRVLAQLQPPIREKVINTANRAKRLAMVEAFNSLDPKQRHALEDVGKTIAQSVDGKLSFRNSQSTAQRIVISSAKIDEQESQSEGKRSSGQRHSGDKGSANGSTNPKPVRRSSRSSRSLRKNGQPNSADESSPRRSS